MTRAKAATRNIHGHTLDALGMAIVAGRYLSGASIPPEPTLCEELGVSRTVVREAVKSLVAKGLLVTGPKLGTRVLPADQWNWFDPDVVGWQGRQGLSPQFLRELQELRRMVEPAAARLAAERATPADIAEIESAYAGMQHAIDHGGDYISHDVRFHQGLLAASTRTEPQHRGMELHELQVGDLRAGSQGEGHAIAGRHRRIGRLGEDLTEAPRREHDRRGESRAHTVALPLAHDVEGDPLRTAIIVAQEVEDERTLDEFDPGIQRDSSHQRARHLGTCRIASGVRDAIAVVASLAREGQCP